MANQHVFEIVDDVAIFRMAGTHHFGRGSRLVASALAHAFAARHDRLLVDATHVDGVDPPSIPARHEMVRQWARAAQGWVRLALVVRPELIDREKFAVVAARNFGFVTEVFEAEADAFAWLQALGSHPAPGRAILKPSPADAG